MPIVTIQVIKNVFTDDQRDQMIENVTEAMIEVEGEAMRDKTWVLFEEVRPGSWTIGGKVPQLPPIGS
ncbi:MAG: 4-oxalocrotonate tautomerase [Polaribacter sp.]|jgi:4-oxalocrotonate tautomerase